MRAVAVDELLKVGEVSSHELSDRDGKVTVRIFIYEPHQALIRPRSRFWVSAGLQASFGSQGLQLDKSAQGDDMKARPGAGGAGAMKLVARGAAKLMSADDGPRIAALA